MYADIEALVLSGQLFNGPERSSSPIRSRSPSPEPEDKGWHDEELVNTTTDNTNDVTPQESIGMGPGRTGVKGVIRDHNEAQKLSQSKRNQEIAALNASLEKSALTAKSFLEEERSKPLGEKVDPIVQAEREKWERDRTAKRDVFGGLRHGKFGHLREVGFKGFVGAVENEEKGVWVVVHLYEPSLDRCFILDDTLTHLARLYPDTKFLRCKAAALGFTSTTSKERPRYSVNRPSRPSRSSDSDEEEFDEKDSEEDEEKEGYEDHDVDTDMLPTLLVYRSGQLVHNWVRVDWEAGQAGIEELLEKHHILPRKESFFTSLGVHSDDEAEDDDDDEGDLLWGDSDSET